MIIQRKGHGVPGLNTTSTADISFMLLIFFLVTTSMDVDKGLERRLPPMEPKKETIEAAAVDKKNLLVVEITADNKLTVNEQPATMDTLRRKILDLAHRAGDKHVISLRCDRDADYNTYFKAQNEIISAYNQWRDEVSHKRFGKGYGHLTAAQQEEVRQACPHRVAEDVANNSVAGKVDLEEGDNP